MRQAKGVNRQLSALQTEAIHAYEEKLECGRAQHAIWTAWQRSREEEKRRAGLPVPLPIPSQYFDLKSRESLHERRRKEAAELFRKLRSCVSQPPSRKQAEAAARSALVQARKLPGRAVVPASSALLLSGDARDLAGNPGKRGNPWVFPSNPALLFLQKQATGSLWACAAQPYSPPAKAVVWFSFYPDKSATWNFLFLANFLGTYGVMTDFADLVGPAPWNWLMPFLLGIACAGSRVSLNVAIDVYQHGWHGVRNFNLISVDTKTDNFMNQYNEKLQFDYQAPLVKSDLTLGKMEISLDTGAKGDKYAASIDFATQGFIQPLVMMAWSV